MGVFSKWSILEKVEDRLEYMILDNPTYPFIREGTANVFTYKDRPPEFYISCKYYRLLLELPLFNLRITFKQLIDLILKKSFVISGIVSIVSSLIVTVWFSIVLFSTVSLSQGMIFPCVLLLYFLYRVTQTFKV